jgi:putative endonuclease
MPADPNRRPVARDPPRGRRGRRAPGRRNGAIGRRGEQLAAAHLRRLGFAIVAQNVRTRGGEIDLIACDGSVLAFVEVKTTRARGDAGSPLERLGGGQRALLRRLAVAWLLQRPAALPRAPQLRFDAIGVVLDGDGRLLALEHLEGAW